MQTMTLPTATGRQDVVESEREQQFNVADWLVDWFSDGTDMERGPTYLLLTSPNCSTYRTAGPRLERRTCLA